MSLRVNNNVAALNAYRNLSVSDGQQSKQLEKLSSGFRINRAADDAAGLSISEGLRSQVGGLKVAVRNAQDGISLVQTAEGALTETHALLQRVRDLAVQSANGTNNSASRQASADEAKQALEEIDRISSATKFGGKTLLDGSQSVTGITFQVGADASPGSNQVTVKVGDLSSKGLGLAEGLSTDTVPPAAGTVTTGAGSLTITSANNSLAFKEGSETVKVDLDSATYASDASLVANAQSKLDGVSKGRYTVTGGAAGLVITSAAKGDAVDLDVSASNTFSTTASTIVDGVGKSSVATQVAYGSTKAIAALDTAVSTVSSQRATLGAYQNRLEHTIANLSVTSENLSASESRIRDADMAQEMLGFTRSQILTQAGTAMLAQANQSSQGVLSLLR